MSFSALHVDLLWALLASHPRSDVVVQHVLEGVGAEIEPPDLSVHNRKRWQPDVVMLRRAFRRLGKRGRLSISVRDNSTDLGSWGESPKVHVGPQAYCPQWAPDRTYCGFDIGERVPGCRTGFPTTGALRQPEIHRFTGLSNSQSCVS